MPRALFVIDVQPECYRGALPIRHPVGHLDTITGEVPGSASWRNWL
jgi:hypothetical protein